MVANSMAESQAVANTSSEKDKKIYSGIAARAMKMLAAGANETETAAALGVNVSLISQFKGEEEFQKQLYEMVAASFRDAQAIDENYQKVEKKLSERLAQQSEFIVNPDQILRVLKFANEAKRKVAPNLANANGSGSEAAKLAPTILILPTVITRDFVVNPNNEVVGVNGKELVTLNSTSLQSLLQTKKSGQLTQAPKLQVEKEVNKLPNGTPKQTSSDPYSDL